MTQMHVLCSGDIFAALRFPAYLSTLAAHLSHNGLARCWMSPWRLRRPGWPTDCCSHCVSAFAYSTIMHCWHLFASVDCLAPGAPGLASETCLLPNPAPPAPRKPPAPPPPPSPPLPSPVLAVILSASLEREGPDEARPASTARPFLPQSPPSPSPDLARHSGAARISVLAFAVAFRRERGASAPRIMAHEAKGFSPGHLLSPSPVLPPPLTPDPCLSCQDPRRPKIHITNTN